MNTMVIPHEIYLIIKTIPIMALFFYMVCRNKKKSEMTLIEIVVVFCILAYDLKFLMSN